MDWNELTLIGTVIAVADMQFVLEVHGEQFVVVFQLMDGIAVGDRLRVSGRVRPTGELRAVLVERQQQQSR